MSNRSDDGIFIANSDKTLEIITELKGRINGIGIVRDDKNITCDIIIFTEHYADMYCPHPDSWNGKNWFGTSCYHAIQIEKPTVKLLKIVYEDCLKYTKQHIRTFLKENKNLSTQNLSFDDATWLMSHILGQDNEDI